MSLKRWPLIGVRKVEDKLALIPRHRDRHDDFVHVDSNRLACLRRRVCLLPAALIGIGMRGFVLRLLTGGECEREREQAYANAFDRS
jgi:hypothetical protein